MPLKVLCTIQIIKSYVKIWFSIILNNKYASCKKKKSSIFISSLPDDQGLGHGDENTCLMASFIETTNSGKVNCCSFPLPLTPLSAFHTFTDSYY